MKAIYNLVTFLAALVVLAWAGWETYLHWDVITGKAPMVWHHGKLAPHHKKCCCKECKCENCPKDCAGDCCKDCCQPDQGKRQQHPPDKK